MDERADASLLRQMLSRLFGERSDRGKPKVFRGSAHYFFKRNHKGAIRMEEKWLRIVPVFSAVIALIICGAIFLTTPAAQTSQEGKYVEVVPVSGGNQLASASGEAEAFRYFLELDLPEDVIEDNISISSIPIDGTLKINIANIDEDAFWSNPLRGSSYSVSEVLYDYSGGIGEITVVLDGLCEFQAEMLPGKLRIYLTKVRDIYERIVVIDPGHGSVAGGTSRYGLVEKEVNLAVALKLQALLEESDIKAYFTRVDDSNPSFAARANLANNTEADFFVSIHCNGNNTRSAKGTEVLYDEKAVYSGFGTKEFAQVCLEEVVKSLGSHNRGLVKGNEIYVVRSTKVPAALVEIGFITNKQEAALLKSEEYQQKAAQGIYNGILRGYEEREKQGELTYE